MDFKDVGHITRGVFDPGRVRVQEEGIFYKSSRTGKTFQVRESEFSSFEWMRAAKGYEIKILTREGSVTKLAGFKESDYAELKEYFKSQYHKDLPQVELCSKGWNWGEASFRGSLMSFLVDNKPAFEIPLKEVSQVTMGKNEVVMEFHQSDEAAMSLVEMRFHIPPSAGGAGEDITGEEVEEDPVKTFHDKVLAKADVMQATGDAIVTFDEIPTLTPRGRYSLKAFPTFLQLHGKTFDYKLPFSSITRLFLLPHNDQRQMFFVVGLDPPIRQGQTRYYFVIFLLPIDDHCDVTLTLTEEELEEKYSGKLGKELSGTFYEVFSRVLRNLVGKKITVPGLFKKYGGELNMHPYSANNQCAISCSCRATSGYLYPLDKGFIFVHKPAVYIKFDTIASVNFARMTGGAGISRSFDFEVELKDGQSHHFSSLMKEDYNRLFEFVSEKNIRVKNKGKPQVSNASYDDGSSSEGGHDAYLERMKAEGEERDSEDEDSDFVAGESSDEELEYDTDAKDSGDNSDQGSGSEVNEEVAPKAKKRKMSKSTTSAPKPVKKEGNKKGKDPNAPKKYLSAFFIWLGENRPAIKADNPELSVTGVVKKAGELWKQVSDKSEWERKSAKDKVRYEAEMAEYKGSGSAAKFAAASKTSKSKKSVSSSKLSAGSNKVGGYKSAEFVNSDNDSDEPKPHGTRSGRSKVGEDGLVSLPSEGSSEEAELSSDSESD